MISDLRAIAVLVLLVLVLGVSLIGGSPTWSPNRVVMPAFDPAAIRALRWSRPDASPPIVLSADGVHWTGTEGLLVDPRFISDLFSSLRSARWHRRDSGAHHTFRRTLAISSDDSTSTIDLGEQLEGTGQVWLRINGARDVLLVDGWLAKLVDPAPIDPYERFPFATAGSEPRIRSDALDIQTHPWRDDHGLVAPRLGDALISALERVEYVALSNGPAITPEHLALGAHSFSFGGTCPGTDLVALRAAGARRAACVEPAVWRDVTTAIAELVRGVDSTLDDRPAGFAIDHIELRGGILRLMKRPTITIAGVARAADPERVAELVHALARPSSQPVDVAGGAPEQTLLITPAVGVVVALDLYAGSVQRRGEPRGISIGSADHDIVARPATAYVDSERWSEEAATISELMLDQVTYRRGAVIGEWSREPAGTFDPAIVEMLATAAAKLHAPATSGAATTTHRLKLRFSPPVGAPVIRELALGDIRPASGGTCAAVFETEQVVLPAELCTAVAAVAAH